MTLTVTFAASRMRAGSGPLYRTDELRAWCLMEWRLPPIRESLWAAAFRLTGDVKKRRNNKSNTVTL
jgi:hypothetical protein